MVGGIFALKLILAHNWEKIYLGLFVLQWEHIVFIMFKETKNFNYKNLEHTGLHAQTEIYDQISLLAHLRDYTMI